VIPLFLIFIFSISNLIAQNWDQVLKSTSNPRESNDYYGYKVSISGNFAVVGAPYHDYDQYNINFLNGAGAVFILKKDALGNWVQHQKIVAPDRFFWDLFGYEVKIQDDAIIIGAIGNDRDVNNNYFSNAIGAVYIFRKLADGYFYNEQKLVPTDAGGSYYFGYSADIDGNFAIVGKYLDAFDWQNKDSLRDAGSAYIYEKNNQGKWVLHKKITPSDRDSLEYFGRSVSISGNHAVIGSIGSKYPVSKTNSKLWGGAAYVYTNFGGTWAQNQKLTAPTRRYYDYFGTSVSIDDSLILIGLSGNSYDAYENNYMAGSGAAHLFKLDGFIWKQNQKIVPIDRDNYSYFGSSVHVNKTTLAVGAFYHKNDLKSKNPILRAGAGYIFNKAINNEYAQTSKLVANVRDTNDYFGYSIATTNDFAIVGAYIEDDDENDQNKMINAGTAYIFKNCNSNVEVNINACQTYNSPSGNFTWNKSGTYKDVIKNFKGCDSIITINLNISQPDTQIMNLVACGSYVSPSGQNYWTQSGLYIDHIQNPGACDSVKLINLTVNKNSSKTLYINNCGDYVSPSGRKVWTANGLYKDTIPNIIGCDSILTINLNIVSPSYATHHINACKKFDAFSGFFTWNKSGVYKDTVTNSLGCDSILTIILAINNPDTGVISFGNQLISKANKGLYQWLDCNKNYTPVSGAQGQSFYAKSNGSYALDVADNGCRDTTTCYSLYRVDVAKVEKTLVSVYPNPSDGVFMIDNSKGSFLYAELFNSIGVKISNYTFPEQIISKVDLSEQASGIYLLRAYNTKGELVQFNLVKQ